jgi:phytoene dehydrogenase-like protein
MNPDVIVVGAGVSGLVAALEVQRRGLSVHVVEASDDVGGRVRTDEVAGFLLDRGFQVLLTAYPEARRCLNFAGLDLREFEPGAIVRHNGRFHTISDPIRRPRKILPSAFAPLGTFNDKLLIARLRGEVLNAEIDTVLSAPEVPTITALRDYGFSGKIIERFFRPFLGGIFLDPELATSDRMFRFVYRMFAQGMAAIPNAGIQAIPRQLASHLPAEHIRLNAPVEHVWAGGVRLQSGEELFAGAVVVACDAVHAARLLPQVAVRTAMRGVRCLYFAAADAPIGDRYLVLNGDGEGPINNLGVPSVVAPGYAPRGCHLVSVTVLHAPLSEDHLIRDVREQLIHWFGEQVNGWEYLRTYHIEQALPDQSLEHGGVAMSAVRADAGLYVCGDHCGTASLNGAMLAGRRAADAVCSEFSGSGGLF